MTIDIRTNSTRETQHRLELLGIPADVVVGTIAYVEALNTKQLELAKTSYPHLFAGYHDIPISEDVERANYIALATVADLNEWFDVHPEATSAGKYVRIVRMSSAYSTGPQATSVHSILIKADGRVAKAAGWNGGPVKSTAAATRGEIISRYNVTENLDQLTADLDVHGGYLYSR